ncbi:DUF4064 domain-containing protein [Staphylococcus lutrae]|uniref:DUF4064 domain-containing protein n=1 Tax=Staphylococcus lutrae TaxID=155085 RepID=A0AAC9WJU8_9STAP|nr:DUF4064 domain-containing protein [Staphylococcus lutrae]ARJ51543.1 hypothetical protein B5P37_09585 [Staphylococcus lutrae]PNZ39219.1 DUF4064 domain-containing protein [Staphylococcus lutrae]
MVDEQTLNAQGNAAPLKRTVEKVLTWVGVGLHIVWVIVLVYILSLVKSPEFQNELQLTTQDVENYQIASVLIIALGLVPLIFSVVAAFIFKKQILAGILLIIGALTGLFLTGSLIAALLWLVASIMLFVRKPKNPSNGVYQTDHPYRYDTYDETDTGVNLNDEKKDL